MYLPPNPPPYRREFRIVAWRDLNTHQPMFTLVEEAVTIEDQRVIGDMRSQMDEVTFMKLAQSVRDALKESRA